MKEKQENLKKEYWHDDCKCGVCQRFYSGDEKAKNGAEWVQCSFCHQSDDPDGETGIFMCDEYSYQN